MTITPLPDTAIERVLVVSAHPDDADFGCAGTIASWTSRGIEVHLLVVTHGEQGAQPGLDISGLAEDREREQRAAAAELGLASVRFLDGYRDGWLEPTFDLQRDITRVIREVRPQRVVCQSPERWYDRIQASHPDHLAAGEATVRACYPAAENPYAWPELGLDLWYVGEIWLQSHPEPNHAVDTTDFFELKLAALMAHESQTGHRSDLEAFLRGAGTRMAAAFGLPTGRLAETFRVVPVNHAR